MFVCSLTRPEYPAIPDPARSGSAVDGGVLLAVIVDIRATRLVICGNQSWLCLLNVECAHIDGQRAVLADADDRCVLSCLGDPAVVRCAQVLVLSKQRMVDSTVVEQMVVRHGFLYLRGMVSGQQTMVIPTSTIILYSTVGTIGTSSDGHSTTVNANFLRETAFGIATQHRGCFTIVRNNDHWASQSGHCPCLLFSRPRL